MKIIITPKHKTPSKEYAWSWDERIYIYKYMISIYFSKPSLGKFFDIQL